jgi:DNA recombination-dependent growth factor C
MGLISGSGSFSRYRVKGEPAKDFLEGLSERIGRHAFRNLTEDSTQERSAGWANVMDMFDSRFSELEFLKEPYIAMSMRVDERKIPATALKQYCLEAEERIKGAENLDFLHKRRRADIKEGVKLRLLKRAIPGSKVYDMVWNYSTGSVLFGCTNTKLCDEFQELFLKTFELHLLAMCPYTLGIGFLEKKGDSPDLMDGLSPSNIWEAP